MSTGSSGLASKAGGALLVPVLLLLLGIFSLPVRAEGERTAGQSPAQSTEDSAPEAEPVESRWEIEPPPYELNVKGHWWDPYNQNILKGDYPIHGDHLFFKLTGTSRTTSEGRAIPLPSSPSAVEAGSFEFFGENDTLFFDQKFLLRAELYEGYTAFKPFDWQVVVEGAFDVNLLEVFENAVVHPDVREGTSRLTADFALQEAAVEVHLANISDNYDFVSTKLGRQPFNSDFRGLIFFDVNQGARLFGTADSNRYQYNLVYFHMAEKDTNSELNTFDLRHQQIVIANLYVQDFLFPGWQNQISFHYNFDDGEESGFFFDRQGFLVRPDPVGAATPHNLHIFYLGWTSEGHIGWLNLSHAFYQAFGRDTLNPIAGRKIDVNAQLAFLELSVDRDWMRYQTSVFFTSGDDEPRDGVGRGFDSILDFQKIVGGDVSYWNRQSIRIADRGGVALMQRNSVVPNLRSSKVHGQSNFVNPGILVFEAGATAELTPKLRAVGNVNYVRFVTTEPLEILLKQPKIREDVGVDVGLGLEWRPLLNNNIVLRPFATLFQPVGGFKDIYESKTLFQAGVDVFLVF